MILARFRSRCSSLTARTVKSDFFGSDRLVPPTSALTSTAVTAAFSGFAMTRQIPVNFVSQGVTSVDLARAVLMCEGIVAVPTDTVYGIAGLAQSTAAVRKMYALKQRDPLKPVAICVSRVEDVYKWAQVTVPRPLLDSLLPGAVTLLFNRTNLLNSELNPDTSLVGVRVPDSKFIRALSWAVGGPLALTSANVSSMTSPLSVEEFFGLWPQLDLIVDGGPLCQLGSPQREQRKGSTVVDLSAEGYFKVVRPGCWLKVTKDLLLEHGLVEAKDPA